MSDANELLVGGHVSASGGVSNVWQNAGEIEANCLQIFTANQRQWFPKVLAADEIERYLSERERLTMPVVSHNSYLVNLCSTDEGVRKKSMVAMKSEIERGKVAGFRDYLTKPFDVPEIMRAIEQELNI